MPVALYEPDSSPYQKATTMNKLAALALITSASALSTPRAARPSLRLSAEQEIKDLNLDQMFEVFDQADKTISSSAIPAGQPGSKFVAKGMVGSSGPFGFFDPAGFAADVSQEQYKMYQEAEIKHSRVAMLAFVGIVFGELFNGGITGKITGPAIFQFQQTYTVMPLFAVILVAVIAALESKSIMTAWQPLAETMSEPLGIAKLKAQHVAGDNGFDPLSFKPKNPKALDEMKTKELNNGRLAMIGVAGIVAQELVTGQSIF